MSEDGGSDADMADAWSGCDDDLEERGLHASWNEEFCVEECFGSEHDATVAPTELSENSVRSRGDSDVSWKDAFEPDDDGII